MYKKREKDLDTSPQIKSLQPNNKTRLRELKDKILGIDLCINDTHEKLKSFKQGIITISNPYRQDHKHFFSSTSSSSSLSSTMIIPITSSLPSSSPTSCLLSNQLYTDPLARPIIDTSMRIIDEREKAMKIAYEAYEEIMRKVEKIKIDQQNYLKLVIDQSVQDSEIEKAKAREEYERILKLIDHDLMNKIEQARIQCQQKLEEKIKALYEDIQSVCIETEIDTLNIKKAIQEKINSESSFHNNFNSHTKSYFPNQASSTNNNNNKFILESSISTMTKHDSL